MPQRICQKCWTGLRLISDQISSLPSDPCAATSRTIIPIAARAAIEGANAQPQTDPVALSFGAATEIGASSRGRTKGARFMAARVTACGDGAVEHDLVSSR